MPGISLVFSFCGTAETWQIKLAHSLMWSGNSGANILASCNDVFANRQSWYLHYISWNYRLERESGVFFMVLVFSNTCACEHNSCVVISKNPTMRCELGTWCQPTKTKTDFDRSINVTSFMLSANIISSFFHERLRCRKRHCNSHPWKFLCSADRFWSPRADSVKRKQNTTVTYFRHRAKGVERYLYFWNWCLSSFADPRGTEGRTSWILNILTTWKAPSLFI